jgi:hypothetical protein
MSERHETRLRNRRNLAIGLALAAFIIAVFLATLFRIGGNIAERSF